MKTAMKRLLSFVLVAMMLVSVVPFQASADTTGEVTVRFNTLKDGVWSSDIDRATFTLAENANTVKAMKDAVKVPSGYKATGDVWQAGGSKLTDDTVLTASTEYHVIVEKEVEYDEWTCKIVIDDVLYDSFKVKVVKGTEGTDLQDAVEAKFVDSYKSIYEQIGNGYTKVGDGWSYSDSKVATLNLTATKYELTFEVKFSDGGSVNGGPETVKYGQKYKLDSTDFIGEYDKKLYSAGTWTGGIADGNEITVTGSGKYVITMNATGWQKAELYDKDKNGEYVHVGYAYMNGDKKIVELKDANNYGDQEFLGWNTNKEGTGSYIHLNDTLAADQVLLNKYYAVYKTNVDNGISKLKVKAVYFVDGVEHSRSNGYIFETEVKTGRSDVLTTILSKDGNMSAMMEEIKNQAPAAMKEVNWNKKFYNSSFTTTYSDSNLTVDGDRTVYVKINAEEKDIADVMLYIHKKVSKTPTEIIEMKGYLPGDDVTLADAKAVAKDHGYRADSYKMYTDREWTQMLNDNNPKVTETIEAEDGTTKIHLYLDGAYKVNNSDNPKTGDTILMAITALGLSATALAAIYFFTKKKQAI